MYKMTDINILDFNSIDIDKLNFNKPEKIKGGSYMSLCNYNNENIYIQSPRLTTGKGILKNDTRCSLDLEFDKSHWRFYEFMTNIDDHNVIQIQKNSQEWFDKEFPLDIVEDFYNTPIKIGRGNKPPVLRIKIPLVKGEIGCSIYNAQNNIITHNDIKIDSKILCVLKFQGLRFLKQQVICEWVPIQLKVFQTGNNNVYLINDNLLSDVEHEPKIRDSNIINNNIESYNLLDKESVDNNDNLEPVEPNDNNDNLEPVEPNDNNDNLEPVEQNNNDDLETVEPNDNNDNLEPVEQNNNNDDLETVEQNDNNDDLETVEQNDNDDLETVEQNDNNDDLETVEQNDNNDLEIKNIDDIIETGNTELNIDELSDNDLSDDSDNSDENNLENVENEIKINYEKIISDKDLIINELQNKLNKLKDFIN